MTLSLEHHCQESSTDEALQKKAGSAASLPVVGSGRQHRGNTRRRAGEPCHLLLLRGTDGSTIVRSGLIRRLQDH